MKSNCLFFALALWWRRRRTLRRSGVKRRVYFQWRMSDWGPFLHFLVEEGKHKVSYKPESPVKRPFPPPFFNGKVRWGDDFPSDEH